jgi:B-box zinc finger
MTADQTNLTPTCVNHPGVETRLTCSSCGTPICPRCMVTTAVGQKCRDCARQTRQAKGTPAAPLVARAFGAGFAVAVVGGFVLLATPFLRLILAAVLGLAVAATTRWAARRRMHAQLGLAAGAAAVLGVALVALVLGANVFHPQLLLTYLIAGGVAYARGSGVW